MDTVNWLTRNIPRWALMWGIAVTLFAAFKTISFLGATTPPDPAGRKLAYLFLWPGMDAAAFLGRRPVVSPKPSKWGGKSLERSHRALMTPKKGWFFTQGLLVLTLPLLVLPPFVLRVINPFVDFLHGLVS